MKGLEQLSNVIPMPLPECELCPYLVHKNDDVHLPGNHHVHLTCWWAAQDLAKASNDGPVPGEFRVDIDNVCIDHPWQDLIYDMANDDHFCPVCEGHTPDTV